MTMGIFRPFALRWKNSYPGYIATTLGQRRSRSSSVATRARTSRITEPI